MGREVGENMALPFQGKGRGRSEQPAPGGGDWTESQQLTVTKKQGGALMPSGQLGMGPVFIFR